MKIDPTAIRPYAGQPPRSAQASTLDASMSFAAILKTRVQSPDPAGSKTADAAERIDFTAMTRQELFDWMNGEIRAGRMSLEESTPFLGMTMKISVATGQPVDMATDTERIDFIDRARLGVEGALSRNERGLAERLRKAVSTMLGVQAQPNDGVRRA